MWTVNQIFSHLICFCVFTTLKPCWHSVSLYTLCCSVTTGRIHLCDEHQSASGAEEVEQAGDSGVRQAGQQVSLLEASGPSAAPHREELSSEHFPRPSVDDTLHHPEGSPETHREGSIRLDHTKACCVYVFTETWLNDNIPPLPSLPPLPLDFKRSPIMLFLGIHYGSQIYKKSGSAPFLEIWVRWKRERVVFLETLWVSLHTGDTYLFIKDIKKCILHNRWPLI